MHFVNVIAVAVAIPQIIFRFEQNFGLSIIRDENKNFLITFICNSSERAFFFCSLLITSLPAIKVQWYDEANDDIGLLLCFSFQCLKKNDRSNICCNILLRKSANDEKQKVIAFENFCWNKFVPCEASKIYLRVANNTSTIWKMKTSQELPIDSHMIS